MIRILLLFLTISVSTHAQYLRPHAPEWDGWTFTRTANSGGHLSTFWWMFSPTAVFLVSSGSVDQKDSYVQFESVVKYDGVHSFDFIYMGVTKHVPPFSNVEFYYGNKIVVLQKNIAPVGIHRQDGHYDSPPLKKGMVIGFRARSNVGLGESDLVVYNFKQPVSCEIKLSPNPVTNVLNIDMGCYGTDGKILFPVYNFAGMRVGTIANTRYDVSHLKLGVYFVRIHEQSFKFIKQ